MLNKYFKQLKTLDRIQASWLSEPIERYVTSLHNQKYATSSISRRVSILMHFGEFAQTQGAKTWQELPDLVEPFITQWRCDHGKHCKTKEAIRLVTSVAQTPINQMLRLVIPDYTGGQRISRPLPLIDRAPGFFTYLEEERGLRELTIRSYVINLRRLERYLQQIDLDSLNALSPPVLSAFMTESSQSLSKNPLHCLGYQLRIFLRYLYREGLILQDLSATVDAPRVYRLSEIPRSISWGDVQRMLDVVDCRDAIGKRDYAILLLLVTYGLRAREVAGITLDTIDWQQERLRVPERKAGHSTAYPLSPVVGEAIVDYLQYGRPESEERTLFLRAIAPYNPLRWEAVAQRASHYLKKSGVQVARAGSHTLRHSCIQRLVDANFPLKTIGDYVAHSLPSSTQVYTKINVEALRNIALGDGEDVL